MHAIPYLAGYAHTAGCYAIIGGDGVSKGIIWTDDSWLNRYTIAATAAQEIRAFGFGKPAPGKDFPSVYLVGYVNDGSGSKYGVWRGVGNLADWTATSHTGTGIVWTYYGAFPKGRYDAVRFVTGDLDIYGQFYTGFAGSEMLYYKP
jgi:hypothetical protein